MDDEPLILDGGDELISNDNEEFFPKYYDRTEIFEKTILPLVRNLMCACREFGIPMLTSIQYKSTEDNILLSNSVVIPEHGVCDVLKKAIDIIT